MSVNIDCFENIIGISRTECVCYPDQSAQYNTSESGLYLDELETLPQLNGLTNCEDGNIWQILDKSREQAILSFIADMNGELIKNFRLKRKPFKGLIGRNMWKTTHSLALNSYAGLTMYCADIVSGIVNIQKIGLLFDTSTSFDVIITDNLNNIYGTYTVTSVANTYTEFTLPMPLELPLHSEQIDNLQYYIYYQVNGFNPLNNDLSCGCGGFKPIFDLHNPYCSGSQTPNNKSFPGWANFFMVAGWKYTTLPTFYDEDFDIGTDNYMYGLTLTVDVKCKTTEVLCKDSLDFDGNPLAHGMAQMIRYKASEILITDLLRSTNLNRSTMMNAEQLIAFRNENIIRYNELKSWFIENVDIKTNDCFQCKDMIQVLKTGIFA